MQPLILGFFGAVFGALLIALLAWWWFRRKLRRLAEGIGNFITGVSSQVPPFRIRLESVSEPGWNDESAVDQVSAELERLGFRWDGDYVVPELNDMPLKGMVHSGSGIVAALYEHPATDRLIADLVAFFPDDTSCKVSNAPESGIDSPGFARKIRVETDLNASPSSVAELHETILTECGGRELKRVSVDEFAACFREEWARTMDWHVDRGGVSPDEIRRVAALSGEAEPDDEAIELARAGWTSAIRLFVEDQIRDRFLRADGMSANEWELKQDRVRFVHEATDLSDLIETLAWDIVEGSSLLCDENEDEEESVRMDRAQAALREAFNGVSLREGIGKAQVLLPKNMRWKFLCGVDGKHPADAYLVPDAEDEDEESDD